MTAVFPSPAKLDWPALRRRHRDLADYIDGIAEQPLSFRGPHAIAHSADNHRHLWAIEWWADKDANLDLAFRGHAVSYILHRWRERLTGHTPTHGRGFRLYLYEDVAPTVSVVAETGEGCPYGGDLTFVDRIGEVLKPYAARSWSSLFSGSAMPSPEAILKAVKHANGSLRSTSRSVGMPLAELRRVIENYGLAADVNAIRKYHRRRPARFKDPDTMLPRLRIWEYRIAV